MAITPSIDDEVGFLTGVKSDGTVTTRSYWAWNGDNPATFDPTWTRDSKWGGTTAGTSGGTVYYYFDPASNWSATEQAQLGSGLALWAAVANINFVPITNASQAGITFIRGNDGAAYTYTIYSATTANTDQAGSTVLGTINSAPISIDTSVSGFGPINGNFSNWGGYPIETFLHEEGHALGLGHAGAYNDTAAGAQQFSAYDSRQWSIMSYFNPGQSGAYSSQNPVSGTNWNGNYPTTLMPLDIQAAQRLYGVAVNTPLSGGQTFGFNCNIAGPIEQYFDFTKNTHPVITIWDKGTNNTLDLSGFGCTSSVNLNPGTWSSTAGMTNNIAIAAGTNVDKLVCSAGGTTVTCNSNNDTVIGGAGNDVITLGSGNDTISGGGGTNTVVFGGAYASYTFTANSDGSLTVTGSGIGTDRLAGIQNLQFSDQTVLTSKLTPPTTPPPAPSPSATPTVQRDFNGDGKSDILMMNSSSSTAQIYFMNGLQATSSATIAGPAASGWNAVLTGDFNGDRNADIVWQNTSTQNIVIDEMSGSTVLSGSGPTSLNPGAGWKVVGQGDFNGDGKSDLVLQNGGQIEIWLMNGTTVQPGSGIVSQPAPSGFHVVATGDFNGDGKADILWQNSGTGQMQIWMMNGNTLTSTATIAANPGPSWRAIDTGDYWGDGHTDILFQNSDTGQGAVWHMNGSTYGGGGGLAVSAGTQWAIIGSGDYNGDGKADILFRNISTGAMGAWEMSGTTFLSGSGQIGVNPGTGFYAVAG